MELPKKLDLGPGPWKKPGFFGIDCREFWDGANPAGKLKVDADLIHDLNDGIPFPDSCIEEIYASHFLEHVSNPYFLLGECWRVLINKGVMQIIVPLYEIKSVDHITCFYPDWFERNISLPGAVLKGKFFVKSKDVRLVNVPEEHRAFWILEIFLVAVK